MSAVHRRFLPDRFRPRAPYHRPRRRLLLPAAMVLLSLCLVPLWTVRSVEVHGAEIVPVAVTASLQGLVGHLVPQLELEWLHQVAATRPVASEVRVHLDLPGTLVVEIFPEPARGSVPVGSGWHAVAADGRLAGILTRPHAPELVGFRRPSDRRMAFKVARRLAEASGGEVLAVQQVTPADYRVGLQFDRPGGSTTVHVVPEGTAAEEAWCELAKKGESMVGWVDLRWSHRMVLRAGAAREPELERSVRASREAAG